MVFEYELPLNIKVEKLSAKFTAISLLDQGQYLGLYFGENSADDCFEFSKKLDELCVKLRADSAIFELLQASALQKQK